LGRHCSGKFNFNDNWITKTIKTIDWNAVDARGVVAWETVKLGTICPIRDLLAHDLGAVAVSLGTKLERFWAMEIVSILSGKVDFK
jgi:hypothetical protein